jgi:hypothetical protein
MRARRRRGQSLARWASLPSSRCDGVSHRSARQRVERSSTVTAADDCKTAGHSPQALGRACFYCGNRSADPPLTGIRPKRPPRRALTRRWRHRRRWRGFLLSVPCRRFWKRRAWKRRTGFRVLFRSVRAPRGPSDTSWPTKKKHRRR